MATFNVFQTPRRKTSTRGYLTDFMVRCRLGLADTPLKDIYVTQASLAELEMVVTWLARVTLPLHFDAWDWGYFLGVLRLVFLRSEAEFPIFLKAERITRLLPDRQRGYFLFTNDDDLGSKIASFEYTCKRLVSLNTATGTWHLSKTQSRERR